MINTVEVTLKGLSCGHCINRVKACLESLADVDRTNVTLTTARVTGNASPDVLIAAINAAGYEAVLSHPKANPLAESQTPPEALTAVQDMLPAIDTDSTSQQLLISGMNCASCVMRVQQALSGVAGVTQASVNLAEHTALVMGSASSRDLVRAIEQAGYGAEAITDENERRSRQQQTTLATIARFRWQAIVALSIGIPVMIWGMFGDNMMVTENNRIQWLIIGIITLAVMILAGGHFYRNAWKSLIHRTATMDTLIALGTGAAWLYSISVNLWPQAFPEEARHLYYEASTMIIGLINLGHMLEARARARSSTALSHLLDLTPPTARLVTPEGDKTLPLAEVQPGMVLRLTTGDRVPVDGEIIQGEAWLDEAMLTGEPLPQQKSSGETLHAGTVVQDGSILFTASRTGNHTTLARIIHLVRQAQSSKPEVGKLADRISAVFVPVVVAIALISGAIWYCVGPAPQIVYTLVIMTTVLIIACPCALGLATPMSIIAGTGRAAELGVLVRDADALQRASELDTLVFDKTGTLTEGRPRIVSVHTAAGFSEPEALRLAAALEQGSSHPLGQAILENAGTASLPEVNAFRTLRGFGVSGEINGQSLLLGNRALMHEHHVSTAPLDEAIHAASTHGNTPVLLAIDGTLTALISLRDTLHRLRKQGYRLIMLTGDDPTTAQAIADEVGIDSVIAGVLPEGKAEAIKALQRDGHRVAMVGDGINDAPALAQADVSIAMGSGSDVAIETAAITLMRQHLTGVADALAISRATLRNMKQNLLGALVYNVLSIPIAAGILWPLTGTLLNPVVAGAAMALSSITVVSNANRLLRFQPSR